jgi:serine/threonine protein kinase/tetratricopeptide (TPR) repeat protein
MLPSKKGKMISKCPKCHTENSANQKYCGHCATPLHPDSEASFTKTMETPSAELSTGSTFGGRFRIIEELGQGGMGKVYKVHDTEIKDRVALKLLKEQIASDGKTIERFRNEIRLARKIAHKNVGKTFDLGKAGDSYYITMEYVEGQDLKGLIRQSGHLALETSIKIAKEICEGLTEAHGMGVVHRDLKPGNIMIDKEGRVRIMDFGIARSTKEKGGELTGEGIMIGTPVYMSPEQAEAKAADERSDIYSVGVMLYEMLTGRAPYEGDTSLVIAMKHRGEKPRDPRELNPLIPESLSRLILKCLERDPEERYQSAKEISSVLAGLLNEVSTGDLSKSELKPTTVEISRTKLKKAVLLGGSAGVVLLVAVILLVFFPARRGGIDSLAVLPFESLTSAADTEYLSNGITESLINQLSRLAGLKVTARYSVFQYKGKDVDPRQVGRELGVKAVLMGRVDLRGESLVVGADLVDVSEGTQIWGDRFERNLDEVLDIEANIVTTITSELRLNLSGEDRLNLSRRYPRDSKAYNLYLQGRYYIYGTSEEMNKALDYFQQAVEQDPNFALGYAAIAEAYTTQAFLTTKSRQEALPTAKAALERALEIDENLAEAHTAAGVIKLRFEWDWPGAEKEFRLGIQLNPGSSEAHLEYGLFLNIMGRLDESLVHALKAHELDPLATSPAHWVAVAYWFRRDYEATEREFKKVLEFHPNWYWGYVKLGTVYAHMGDFSRALAAAEKAEELIGEKDNPLSRSWLGHLYALIGEVERAEEVLSRLQEMEERRYIDPWVYAEVCAPLGRTEAALDALEKAYQESSPNMIYLKAFADNRFKNVSSEPRYQELLRLLNFK